MTVKMVRKSLFNEKGELIRDMNCGNVLRLPENFPFHLMYSDWGVYEYDTGYRNSGAHVPWKGSKYGEFEEYHDVGIPESTWSDETMCHEFSTCLFWR